MEKFSLTIDISVDQCWMDDGVDLNNPHWKESIENAITNLMGYATPDEFVVEVKDVKHIGGKEFEFDLEKSLSEFRCYFNEDFMSDEDFKSEVFMSDDWEYETGNEYFYASQFQIPKEK